MIKVVSAGFSRAGWAAALLIGFSLTATAEDEHPAAQREVEACEALEDKDAKLDCYRSVIRKLEQRLETGDPEKADEAAASESEDRDVPQPQKPAQKVNKGQEKAPMAPPLAVAVQPEKRAPSSDAVAAPEVAAPKPAKTPDAKPEMDAAPKEQEFGAERTKSAREKRNAQKSVRFRISSVERSLRGRLIVHFENGQLWRQADSDTTDVILPRTASGLEAKIWRSFTGAYFMKIERSGRKFRVIRVQ